MPFSFGKVLKCFVRSFLYFTVTLAEQWKYLHPMKVMEGVCNFFPVFKSNCLEYLNVILCLSHCPLVSKRRVLSSKSWPRTAESAVKKYLNPGVKKRYILLELSQVLNGLDKQHKTRNTSLLTYTHCPCYKVFVHSIIKPWFWLYFSRC